MFRVSETEGKDPSMKSVCDVLHGQTPNALYPFLWVHGVESEEELRREVQKIRESGIGGFCVEARPHKDFNGLVPGSGPAAGRSKAHGYGDVDPG